MPDLITKLAKIVETRIRAFGCDCPPRAVVKSLLETAYYATLKTEEGKFVRSSVTFVNPTLPASDAPPLRRADYPAVWPFGHRTPFNVERLVKLSRAIDMWSSSIAVHCQADGQLFIWGVIDQLVQFNIRLNREAIHRHLHTRESYEADSTHIAHQVRLKRMSHGAGDTQTRCQY